jgi:hypothetical protein
MSSVLITINYILRKSDGQQVTGTFQGLIAAYRPICSSLFQVLYLPFRTFYSIPLRQSIMNFRKEKIN